MGFFSFLVLLGIAYLIWRVTDQLPDLIFRLSEIQRDVADMRRTLNSERGNAAKPDPAPVAEPRSTFQTPDDADDNRTGF
ncbi:MAG: hypothetical protein O3A63_01495 [Proteobacteria bacterium]|nr:hypothetical protein [Pseudomonadota bacterium]